MLYFIFLQDIDDNTEIRANLLDEHMQHIGNYMASIKLGGPLLREGSEQHAGGILIVDSESEADVRHMIHHDPYFKAGLWDDVKVYPFKEILNAWR